MMAAAVLVAATPSPAFCCCSYRRPALLLSSPPLVFDPRNPKSHVQGSIPHLGLGLISPWSGLKHLGIASRKNYGRKEKKGKCRGRVVYASLFGVGAPEALVIGVVALLVFGPKGLAEVARNLGKSLRAFQPTIRELQEVSREFKSTLEREIGLDEVASSTNTYRSTSFSNENQQAVVDPNGTPTAKSYTSDELLKVTEDQLAAASTRPQTEASNPEGQSQAASTTLEVAASGVTTPEVAAPTPEVTVSPEAGAQIPSSKKAENER